MHRMYGYGFSDLLAGVRAPRRAAVELNALYHRRGGRVDYNRSGCDLFAADWDNLLILDACRYDEYARLAPDDGRLERRESRGAATDEFLRGNFAGRTLHDTVYASANPWFLELRNQLEADVHAFVNLRDPGPDTDLERYTVLPETVTATARALVDEYPHKRLIIHYMQPHQPYIGPTGREHFEVAAGLRATLASSDVTDARLRRAYRENLERVRDAAMDLVKTLPGKTVITADHGELLGERSHPLPVRTYGHFPGLHVEELLAVPWHVFTTGERKEIIATPPAEQTDQNDAERVQAQLRALGYRL